MMINIIEHLLIIVKHVLEEEGTESAKVLSRRFMSQLNEITYGNVEKEGGGA